MNPLLPGNYIIKEFWTDNTFYIKVSKNDVVLLEWAFTTLDDNKPAVIADARKRVIDRLLFIMDDAGILDQMINNHNTIANART